MREGKGKEREGNGVRERNKEGQNGVGRKGKGIRRNEKGREGRRGEEEVGKRQRGGRGKRGISDPSCRHWSPC